MTRGTVKANYRVENARMVEMMVWKWTVCQDDWRSLVWCPGTGIMAVMSPQGVKLLDVQRCM